MESLLFPVDEVTTVEEGPVTCLGITFNNDTERREYFRNELRKKLPELKCIEGFPIGEDEDIIALSDPPYYTACPNPWINDFIKQWENEKKDLQAAGKRTENFEVKEPYASDIHEGKYDPLYLLHPYLTKVPPKAIMAFYDHYTQPGDIVLDGFAGTGMSGLAAKYCSSGHRNSICVDLSTLASFIGYFGASNESNHNFKCNVNDIITSVFDECKWMYETNHNNGTKGIIDYVIWSNVYQCPHCGCELNFYNLAYDEDSGKVADSFNCPSCNSLLTKAKSERIIETQLLKPQKVTVRVPKRMPAYIGYTYNGKRFQKKPDLTDIQTLQKIEDFNIPYWVPEYKIISGDEINRAKRDGIEYFSQYYTKRTLIALCAIKNKVSHPFYNCLLTKIAFQSTIMYRFCKKGGGPMSGTMYVPALIKELNIFNQLKAFIKDREKINIVKQSNVLHSTQSSTDLCSIPSNSIDYIFTDPPFGSNLMYSELNFISEMWLKVTTNNSEECIENNTQSKSIFNYQSIISRVFKEYYRVLKHGCWLSVEFSNTSAEVWNSIQNAIKNAGFLIVSVSALDKKKRTYKAVTTTTAVDQDLVITCFKPSKLLEDRFSAVNYNNESTWDFIEEMLEHLPVHICQEHSTTAIVERSPKILFDRLISYYVQHGYAVPMNAAEFQKGLKERFVERDGMYFTAEQALEYEDKKKETTSFVSLALLVGSEAEGIEWLKRKLEKGPLTYSDIHPDWMQDLVTPIKGDKVPELMQILEENFLKDENGYWHIPDLNDQAQKEAMKTKRLLKEFAVYVEAKKVKEARLEALRCGFKECYKNKDFATIVAVGNKLPEELLMTDEVLLQYYDIAASRV